MASFEEESRGREQAVAAQQSAARPAQEVEEERNARFQAELEQARREGYKIGLQQGFDAGIADAAEQVQQDREQLQAVLASMGEALNDLFDI